MGRAGGKGGDAHGAAPGTARPAAAPARGAAQTAPTSWLVYRGPRQPHSILPPDGSGRGRRGAAAPGPVARPVGGLARRAAVPHATSWAAGQRAARCASAAAAPAPASAAATAPGARLPAAIARMRWGRRSCSCSAVSSSRSNASSRPAREACSGRMGGGWVQQGARGSWQAARGMITGHRAVALLYPCELPARLLAAWRPWAGCKAPPRRLSRARRAARAQSY
jgi:hypothetical protein